jgi:putative spermidine/putrescine transport system substrate-binding protein
LIVNDSDRLLTIGHSLPQDRKVNSDEVLSMLVSQSGARAVRTAILAAIGCAAIAAAPAIADDNLVVGTYGGVFLENVRTCNGSAFEKLTGKKVTFVAGNSVEAAARLRATKGKPSVDVVYLDIEVALQAKGEGLIEKIGYESLKSTPEVMKSAFDPEGYFITTLLDATTLVYNPEFVKTPPTSWQDLFDPKYKGKIVIPDITATAGVHLLLQLARLNGGSEDNVEPGFEALKKLAPNVVTLWTQGDQVGQLFQRGDAVIAVWYPDRAGAAQDKGVSVKMAYPKEGSVGLRSVLTIAAGTQKKTLAEQFIDATLSADAQKCFAEKGYLAPVNTKVQLSGKSAELLPSDVFSSLWYPDAAKSMAQRAKWTERWRREVVK